MPLHLQICSPQRPATHRRVGGLLLLLACVAMTAGPALAQEDEQQRLQQLRARITELSESISTRQAEHDTLSGELRASELHVSSLRSELARVDTDLANTRDTLAGLELERAAQQERIAAQRKLLARQARASFMLMRVDYLQVLLSQKDPGTLARSRAYHRYVSQARAAQIEALRVQLDAVLHLQVETAERRAHLSALQTSRSAALAELQQGRAQRASSLARIEADLGERGKRLERLQRDASALAELITRLQTEMAELALEGDDALPFAEQRGKLPWPATGAIDHGFGSARGDTALTWQGILIRAKRGASVHAVSRGRVAYADWLRGFGLMAIVDHGDGFMSLYAHNDTLARETGDWVNSGDVLGTVGDSGGLGAAGLYFEIRKTGTPQNPTRWLAKR